MPKQDTMKELWDKCQAAMEEAAFDTPKNPNPINVMEGDRVVDTIPDLCGFAWVNFKMKSGKARKFGRWLIENGYGRKDSYYRGVTIWIHTQSQGITKKQKMAGALAEVLRAEGIEARTYSRLD